MLPPGFRRNDLQLFWLVPSSSFHIGGIYSGNLVSIGFFRITLCFINMCGDYGVICGSFLILLRNGSPVCLSKREYFCMIFNIVGLCIADNVVRRTFGFSSDFHLYLSKVKNKSVSSFKMYRFMLSSIFNSSFLKFLSRHKGFGSLFEL